MLMFDQRRDVIWLRTEPDNHYQLTLPEFTVDFNTAVPELPEGVVQRIYEPGKRHPLITADSNVIGGGPMPWPEGDDILARADVVMRAKEAGRVEAQEAAVKTQATAQEEAKAKMDAELAQLKKAQDARLANYMANRMAALDVLNTILKRAGATDEEMTLLINGLWPPPGTIEQNPKGFIP